MVEAMMQYLDFARAIAEDPIVLNRGEVAVAGTRAEVNGASGQALAHGLSG